MARTLDFVKAAVATAALAPAALGTFSSAANAQQDPFAKCAGMSAPADTDCIIRVNRELQRAANEGTRRANAASAAADARSAAADARSAAADARSAAARATSATADAATMCLSELIERVKEAQEKFSPLPPEMIAQFKIQQAKCNTNS